MTQNKKLKVVCDDFKENIEKKKTLTIFITCAIIASASLIIGQKTMEDICNACISIFSSLLGFTITALAILYSLDKENIKKLLIEADDETKPFDVLFTSFTLSAIVQLLAIILALLYISITSENCCSSVSHEISYLSSFMSLLSIGFTFNVILHLFTIRSYLTK